MKSILRNCAIALVFVSTSLLATAQKPTTAIEMNDYLSSVTDSLYKGGQEWGKKLNSIYKTKEFSSLTPIRKKLEIFIDKKKKEIMALPDIGGSEDFRMAMLDFLVFEAQMIKEAFGPLEKFNSSSSDDAIKAAIDNLQKLAEGENARVKRIHETQNEYAAKNGFTIEEN